MVSDAVAHWRWPKPDATSWSTRATPSGSAAKPTAIAARFGVTVTPVAGDVSLPETQRALLAAAPQADILVNNNGGPPPRAFKDLDREAIINGVVQNMATPLELIQAVLPAMKARGFGRIVNITSLSVKMPIAGLDLSSGARAGLTAFLAGVCRTVADRDVTINNLLPGRMDTDRLRANRLSTAAASGEAPEVIAARQLREVPAGRFGTPQEFGQVCAFLCSTHASYITGQNILVDGGLFPGTF